MSAPEKPERAAREHVDVHVVRQRNLLRVHREDAFAALHVRPVDHDAAVETARPQQRRIEHVGTVRGRHEDDALARLEAIHLDQELIQRLLAFVVSAAEARAAMTADRVDFIDEDDAGRVLLALLEQVAHARGADADEHLDEVGTADREERDVGFTRDGARKQRLAGAGRAHEQDALGNASAELLELLGFLQELDDLLQLFLRFVDTSHVLERDLLLRAGGELRAALAERQGFVPAALHLPHDEDPEADHDDQRGPGVDDRGPRADRGLVGFHLDVLRVQEIAEPLELRGRVGAELVPLLRRAGDVVPDNLDRLDVVLLDLRRGTC